MVNGVASPVPYAGMPTRLEKNTHSMLIQPVFGVCRLTQLIKSSVQCVVPRESLAPITVQAVANA